MWRISWLWHTTRHQPAYWHAARGLAFGRWAAVPRLWWLLNRWSYEERAQLVAWHRATSK